MRDSPDEERHEVADEGPDEDDEVAVCGVDVEL